MKRGVKSRMVNLLKETKRKKSRKKFKATKSCTCDKCVKSCRNTPGWFAPGEAEKTAKLLGMSFEEFRKQYLIIEYWVGGSYMYSPRKVGIDEDREVASFASYLYPAPCVFLDENDRCKIHKAKPMECRESFSCSRTERNMRRGISRMWKKVGNPLKSVAGGGSA